MYASRVIVIIERKILIGYHVNIPTSCSQIYWYRPMLAFILQRTTTPVELWTLNDLGTNVFDWGMNGEWFEWNGSWLKQSCFYRKQNTWRWRMNAFRQDDNDMISNSAFRTLLTLFIYRNTVIKREGNSSFTK